MSCTPALSFWSVLPSLFFGGQVGAWNHAQFCLFTHHTCRGTRRSLARSLVLVISCRHPVDGEGRREDVGAVTVSLVRKMGLRINWRRLMQMAR